MPAPLRPLPILLAVGLLWTAPAASQVLPEPDAAPTAEANAPSVAEPDAPASEEAEAREVEAVPRIVDVVIEGEAAAVMTPAELELPTGAVLSRQVVREMVQRLIAGGRWTDVQVSWEPAEGGARLIVNLVARAVLSRVDLRGADAVDGGELLREVELQPGAQLSVEAVERVQRRLTESYAARGYRQAKVVTTLRDTDDPSRKVLVIEVEERTPTRIRSIQVDGDHTLDPGTLWRALPFGEGDLLDRSVVLEGVQRAEQRLRRKGYLDATLGEPKVEFSGTDAHVTLRTRIGPLYRVEIVGQVPLSRGQVFDALKLGEAALTSQAQIDAVAARVVDVYKRQGFVDAEVVITKHRERGANRVGRAVLQVRVVPGAQLDVLAIGFPGARHLEPSFLERQVVSYLEEELPGASLIVAVDSDVVDDIAFGPGRNERSTPLAPHTDPTRTFYAPAYDAAIKHIERLYQAEGFLAVVVGPARLDRTGKNRGVVAVPITEGPRTMLHDVRLIGNEALGAQELVEESGLTREMPFSYLALEDAQARILNLYRERGYLYAKVEPTVRFSQDRTRAQVTIELVERYQVQVGEVVIYGADRTSHGLIRDLVAFEPGDIYRPSVAQESEERLLALGVFSGVTIAPEDAELPARSKRLEVTVTQRPSQVIDLKAGLSTGQGARGSLEYGYRDLFGQAIGLTVRAELAYQFIFVQPGIAERYDKLLLQDRMERNVTLSLVIPQLLRGTDVRTSFELFHIRDNQRDFGLDKNGVGVGFNYQPVRRLTLTLNGDLENNNVDNFTDVENLEELAQCLLASDDPADRGQGTNLLRTRLPEGNTVLVSGRFGAVYDHRDSPFSPTRGYYGAISSEVARTLRTEDANINSLFAKLSLTASGYVPLGRRVVLAFQARGGYILHLLPSCANNPNVECSQTYPNRAFFMGGIDTVRGYYQDSMVPEDRIETVLAASQVGLDCDPNAMQPGAGPTIDANAFARNADAFVLYRAELRFPIFGDLFGALFTDLGNLWANPRLIDPFNVRASVGTGVRLATPVGPLALDYGIVVGARRELGEPTFGTVHFSMGLF